MKRFFYLFLFCFFNSCTYLYYQPTSQIYSNPKQFSLSYEDISFTSPLTATHHHEKLSLHGYLIHRAKLSEPSRGMILFFHGNAENITSHFYHLAWLTEWGYDLVLFDYRGYGQSEGVPDQEGVQLDAQAFLNKGIDIYRQQGRQGSLIVYGHSLGGAISLWALMDQQLSEELRSNIKLTVIEGSFTSYQQLAKLKLQQAGFLKIFSPLVPLLVSEETSPQLKLSQHYQFPVLVIHGEKDSVVPVSSGELIYQQVPSSTKKWFWKIPNGDHGGLYHNPPDALKWRKELVQFFQKEI